MQVLNFGSLNIDHVYTVDHFTAAGETLAARLRGMGAKEAMERASYAASVAVSRPGAAASIPGADEVF